MMHIIEFVTPPLMYGWVWTKTFITHSMDLTKWLLASTMLALDQPSYLSFTPSCAMCLGNGPFQPLATALTAPLLVSFEISNFTVHPELLFSFNAPNGQVDIVYHLSVVIYFGLGHFTSQYIDTSGCCWAYDGQLHGGMMVSEGPVIFLALSSFNYCLPSTLFFLHVSYSYVIHIHSDEVNYTLSLHC